MSQILKKFIGDNQVGAEKILLENEGVLKARNAADNDDIDILSVNSLNHTILSNTMFPSGDGTITLGAEGARFAVVGAVEMNASDAFNLNNQASISRVTGESWDFIEFQAYAPSWLQLKTEDAAEGVASKNIVFRTGDSDTELGVVEVQAGALSIAARDGAAVPLMFADGDALNFVSLKAPQTLVESQVYVLPTEDGEAGEVLSTDGSGQLSWASNSPVLWERETITLSAGDISNEYVDMQQEAIDASIIFMVDGVMSRYGVDYSTSVVGGVTRITFTGHAPTLAAGDVLYIQYQY